MIAMSKYFYNNRFSLLYLPRFMRDTPLRSINDIEKDALYLLLDDCDSGYRAKIILLKDEGHNVPEIRKMTNHHDNNIRKWIHRFNDHGIDGIISKRRNHSAQKITDDIERKIVDIASTNPRKHGMGFSTWSLRVLAGYLMEKKIVKSVSHSEIRNVLLKYNVRWRHSKTMLGGSRDPEYELKKAY
jgi:transposase